MISTLDGVVAATTLDSIVVEVGGVGLLVHTTPKTASAVRVGDTTRIFTSLVVREDSFTLYGFALPEEKGLFEQVQTVSGVGPRLALAMVAVHEPAELSAAISSGNITALTKVPGIGKKGAERIVLELRDKVVALGSPNVPASRVEASTVTFGDSQVSEALVGLGWSVKQADDAVAKVSKLPEAQDAPTSLLLRLALRELGR